MLSIFLAMLVWHGVAGIATCPRHLDQIVSELGAVVEFVGNPCPDHTGSRVAFVRTTETGYGVFLQDIAGKRQTMLYEQIETGPGFGGAQIMLVGWSPDDAWFAYTRVSHDQKELVICNGVSGQTSGTIPIENSISAAIWMTPETLALTGDSGLIYLANFHQDQWLRPIPTEYFRQPAHRLPTPVRGFCRLSNTMLMWQQDDSLFTCKLSGAPEELWTAKEGSSLLSFSYSSRGERILVHCTDSAGQFLAYFNPFTFKQRPEMSLPVRIGPDEIQPRLPLALNDGQGCVYLEKGDWAPDAVLVRLELAQTPVRLRLDGNIRGFAASGDKVFVVGSRNNEPEGLWQYECASGETECVAPNTQAPFRYAHNSSMSQETITNASGELIKFYVLAPVRGESTAKHPLVLGILGTDERGFTWSRNHEAFANCGAYFVTADRHHRSSEQWADDVLAIRNALVRRPDIDSKRVYLYGDSAGVWAVNELLERKSDLWQGGILFSATAFPEPSKIEGTRLFMDEGDADSAFGKEGGGVPKRFQAQAAAAGVPVRLLLHPGLGHIARMPPIERERMRQALLFFAE